MRASLGVVPLAVLLLLAPGIPGSSEPESEPLWFGVIIHRSPTLTAQFWPSSASTSPTGCSGARNPI